MSHPSGKRVEPSSKSQKKPASSPPTKEGSPSQAAEKENSPSQPAEKEEQTKPADHPAGTNTDGHDGEVPPVSNTDEESKDKPGEGVEKKPEVPPTKVPTDEVRNILTARPFIINAFLTKPGADGAVTTEATESIMSRTLDSGVLAKGGRAINLTLATLRKLIKSMSSFSRIHKFCTPSGILVSDETTTLIEYLNIEPPAARAAGATGVPTVNIYYRSQSANPVSNGTPGEQGQASGPQIDTSLKGVDDSNTPPAQLKGVETKLADEVVSQGAESDYGRPLIGAGTLTESQWAMVLRNCAVFYGWLVDPSTRVIKRAPKAAFKIRSTVADDPVSKIPTFSSSRDQDNSKVADKTQTDQKANVMSLTNKTGDAPASPPTGDGIQSKTESASTDGGVDANADPYGDSSENAAGLGSQFTANEKEYQGIPNFRVNDDSRIEVSVHEDELAVSMVRNDFSSQSTSASVSGGAFGVQAGVSAGYASSKSNETAKSSDTQNQIMVGKYLYPRCDLFLFAEDLEPTAEFASLVEKIHKNKDIRALWRLQSDFGQLFCQELTLGGRLMTSKVYTSTEDGEATKAKEEYKTSVGVSVTSPYVSASVNHEQGAGSSKEDSKAQSKTDERHAFEATGGDTILVNNPSAWAATVGRPELWRVINRDNLTSLIDMVSQMPGYEAVQSWIVQAVPTLSRYITLDQSRKVTVRLKVIAPNHDLCLPNLVTNTTTHYLGFMPTINSSPKEIPVVANKQNFWVRQPLKDSIGIFQPRAYRAPMLQGFTDFKIGDKPYGVEYNKDFASTGWHIIAPFTDLLKHGCRVVLMSTPYPKTTPSTSSATDSNSHSAHLMVFRNAQGVYLPGISDSDECQYWRLLKVGATRHGEPIMPGDAIRLCWMFKDQTAGFRDYTDDAYGRRSNRLTSRNNKDVLYLKVPWPRFEGLSTPTTMIMSTESSTQPLPAVIEINPPTGKTTKPYLVEDIQFRIDVLDRDEGDSDDYLLQNVDQEARHLNAGAATVPASIADVVTQVWKALRVFGLQ